MNDITILYYTANRISDYFARNVQQNIIESSGGAPIISVSHKPIDFGHNICIPGLTPGTYNIYKQILIGAMAAHTPYIGCAEDDSLYTEDHFSFRPPLDTFAYNDHRYQVDPNMYFLRRRASMCMCIAPTELLVETLCQRYAKFPRFLSREECGGWGEPGRKEHKLGLPKVPLMNYQTEIPTLTFNHRSSTGGRRKIMETDVLAETLPHWGPVTDLWAQVHGN
jgi:hypothetical protein